LSIVVPAYNEAARLPRSLDEIERYIDERQVRTELIVADDGSTDATAVIARERWRDVRWRRVLALPHRGKAATVRAGILAANGEYVLFTDADLSTPIGYADTLLARLRDGADVAIGSRQGIAATRVGEPLYRHLMGRVFNALVRLLAVPGIDDTQCGFKAFRRDAAHDLFRRALLHSGDREVRGPHVTGFDVEILFLARHCGYRVDEVPVYWEHVAGSKVRPLHDSFRMLADVVRVRWNAARGRYGPPAVGHQ
jgi:glycosyltransferase involved in cell wall biosynthesis